MAIAVIGVAATLLGYFSTYVFQTRTAERAEAFARDERLRQEQLTACSAYAGSLSELKQGLIRIWFHREDQAGSAWKEARVEGDRLGAAAEAACRVEAAACADPAYRRGCGTLGHSRIGCIALVHSLLDTIWRPTCPYAG
jgi:hypothetical protein